MLKNQKGNNAGSPKQECTSSGQSNSRCDRTKPFQDRPRICLIDVTEDIVAKLHERGFNCCAGTLGHLVESNKTRQCLLNNSFPRNLHEYDIVVVDLQHPTTVPYVEKDHMLTQTKGQEQRVLVSSFPETIFDPWAMSASILESRLQPFMEKESILIIFAAKQERIQYHPRELTPTGYHDHREETYWLYDFYPDLPSSENISGEDTRVISKPGSELTNLLERYNNTVVYDITFEHPAHLENNKHVKNKDFLPLIEARPDKIASFVCMKEKNATFLFPRIQNKAAFLTDLLEKVLPGILPGVFPLSTQFAWLANSEYQLPNESKLLEQRARIQMRYGRTLGEVDGRIAANRQKYGFLHDLLTQSGPELVKTVERYVRWLGFENVVNVDRTNSNLQEEDLRVKDDRGILVIEVKGIGGTSTDSDCSQINKIKYRRAKERGAFDVFALYVVNHQRHLSPADRTNPPFNATQIKDADGEERGLITTFDLFKLYFNVINNHITKDDARDTLYKTGLVRFRPSGAVRIPFPYEIHHGGRVLTFTAEDLKVRVGASVVLDDSGQYRSAEVLEVQVEGTPVESASMGQIGIKLSEPITGETALWLVQGH